MSPEGGELRSPDTAIAAQPCIDLGEWLGIEPVETPLGLDPNDDGPGVLKRPEMSGDPSSRHVEVLRDPPRRQLLVFGQQFEYLQPSRVRQTLEQGHARSV